MDKILIVDDDALPRAIMGDALRSRRYGIFEAVDAVEAEAVLRREDITVVLLDVVLPGQSGIEFLPRVREISPSTLTVLVTAHPSIEVAIQALRLGAFDFLKKPFEPEELVHIVEKAAHFRRVTQENLVLANTNQCVVVASDQLVVVVTENAVFVGDRNTDMKTLLEFVAAQAPEIV